MICQVPKVVSFFDNGSYDPNGTIVKWEWNLGNASEGQGGWKDFTPTRGSTTVLYTTPGHYNAHLRVTDNDGNTDVAKVSLDLTEDGNQNPIAMLTATTPASGTAPLEVHFSAAGSYDPDGYILNYEWDLGDGVFVDYGPTGTTASRVFLAGTWLIRLRVTDDNDAIAEASMIVYVNAPPSGPGDWCMFGRDARHTHRSPFSGPATNDLKWSYATDGYVESSPAFSADGTVYVGSWDNKLYAISPDGNLKWSYTTGGVIAYSSPAISEDGTVYIGCNDHKLYALNPNGTLKWTYTAGDEVYFSPAIGVDGTVYVGSRDNKLHAINPDGSPKWAFTAEGWVQSPAIGEDGTVYAGSGDNKLYAINPDGSLKWAYLTWGPVYGSPSIGADGTVYVGNGDGRLYAITPNGALKWTYNIGAYTLSSPATGADGVVYIGSTNGSLYAINLDGSLKWSYTTGGGVGSSSPAIGADGTVYVGSYDNKLYAINSDGSLKWSYITGDDVLSSPAIGADGSVYVGSYDGKLYAIGPGSG